MKQRTRTELQAVDLDLIGANLKSVVRALEPLLFPLQLTSRQACLELKEQEDNVESAIFSIADSIKALPKRTRNQWEMLEKRTINIGINAGSTPHQVRFDVSSAALEELSKMGVDIAFTVYAMEMVDSGA